MRQWWRALGHDTNILPPANIAACTSHLNHLSCGEWIVRDRQQQHYILHIYCYLLSVGINMIAVLPYHRWVSPEGGEGRGDTNIFILFGG